ncbi:MAG: flippase-like domain-containing protein [Candidatus Latescibacteria bacterium]|nr:flippase-like domain-containing protein [Candidatus Latescibacterota bacterium]
MRRLLELAAKLAFSLGLIWYLAYRMDWPVLGQIFAATRWEPFGGAVLLFALSNVLGTAQWHLLLRVQQIPITFRQSLVVYHVGVFFNNVLLGNIGGDAMRIYDIRRISGQASGGVAATAMDRFVGLFSTCTIALVAYLVLPEVHDLASMLVPIWLGLLVVLGAGVSRRAGLYFEGLARRLLPASLADIAGSLRQSMGAYRHRYGLLVGIWFLSLVVQLCRVLVYWAAGLAVGMDVPLGYYVCFQPIAAIIAALPISVGGLGVRENIVVKLFSSLGADANLCFAMSLLGYLAGILASLLGGLAFIFRRLAPAESR